MNSFDDLPTHAPGRRIGELKNEFAQVAEVSPALDYQNIAFVLFCSKYWGICIISFPRRNSA